ncbi:MAG: hypothetical protein LBQ60_05770 [Bacteroidales bacterium]|nr:hypothetical protein [Bacteroidales bacterium]
MKKICIYIFVLAGFFASQNLHAKIWRVNNNPGKSCDFTNLTDALRSKNVSEKDTIHIEGSVTPYGKDTQTATNCDTIRQKLVIIGPGYQLSSNAETQHFKESAKVKTLHVASTAAGTIIAGIEQVAPNVSASYYSGTGLVGAYRVVSTSYYASTVGWGDNALFYKLRIEADSVTVSHSKLFYVDLYNVNRELKNITITKCFFNPGLIAAAAGDKQVTNVIISNNYFRNEWNIGNSYWNTIWYSNLVIDFRGATAYGQNTNNFTMWSSDIWLFPVINPVIQNNTFYSSFSILAKGCQVYNNLFFPTNAYYGGSLVNYNMFGLFQSISRPHVTRNNIVYNAVVWGSPSATPAGADNNNTNNYGGMMPGIDGNKYSSLAESNWFAATTNRANQVYDKSYELGSSSPALDDNKDVTKQRGMFGGLAPYVLSGLYTIPAVWDISIPTYPTGEVPSTGFEVRVKVKSH